MADDERLGEDIRKTYVALTRAKYATWVGLAEHKHWQRSAWGYLLGADADDDRSLASLAQPLSDTDAIRVQPLRPPVEGTFQPDRSFEAKVQPTATRRVAMPWSIASYSRIQYGSPIASDQLDGDRLLGDEPSPDNEDSIEGRSLDSASVDPLSQFPRGAQAGTLLHDCLEWAARQGFQRVLDDPSEFVGQVSQACAVRGWDDHGAMAADWLGRIIQTPFQAGTSEEISLAQLDTPVPELEFMLASDQLSTTQIDRWVSQSIHPGWPRKAAIPEVFTGMFKGFIDLIYQHQGRYFVMDYKSNALAAAAEGYTQDAMISEVMAHRYDLQYALYTVALHRLLRIRLPDYDYEQHVGGVVYWFLRGLDGPEKGIYFDRLPFELVSQLDRAFDGGHHDH